jgi:hypothetical protein
MNESSKSASAQKRYAADIFAKMVAIVEQPGYPLLTHYKVDFYTYDRDEILREASPGARFLWVIRESGTHLQRIGVHNQSNEAAMAGIHAGKTSSKLGCELYLIEGDGLKKVNEVQAIAAMKRMEFTIRGNDVIDSKGQIVASMDVEAYRKPIDANNYTNVNFQLNSNRSVSELKYAVVAALRTIAIDESVSRCQSLFVRVESITIDGQDISDAMDLAAERVQCETALEPA